MMKLYKNIVTHGDTLDELVAVRAASELADRDPTAPSSLPKEVSFESV